MSADRDFIQYLPGKRRLAACLLLYGLVLVPSILVPSRAQPKTVPPNDTTTLARFVDAQALDIDPQGHLYVADAGPDAVYILEPNGTERAALGGTGSRVGEFNRPADVDPTNGQTLLVADAGNGRVQVFSEELQYLESLPVERSGGRTSSQRVFDDGRDGAGTRGDGRPIAVTSGTGDQIYIIDEAEDLVWQWDDRRRPQPVVGRRKPGRSSLTTPVALALKERRRLYVADSTERAVWVYDRFGTFVRQLPTPPLSSVRALALSRKQLWIVCPFRLFVWNTETHALDEHTLPVSDSLVDVAPHGDVLYLLTSTRLLRYDDF